MRGVTQPQQWQPQPTGSYQQPPVHPQWGQQPPAPQWGPQQFPPQLGPVIRHDPAGQAYPYPVAPRPSSSGTVLGGIGLASGLVGLLIFPILCGPLALICGIAACFAHGGDSRARGLGVAGIVLGSIDTLIAVAVYAAIF